MPHHDPYEPRVERPRAEPEILPPRGRSSERAGQNVGFDSLFVRVEEGEDGIRRIYLKRPGPLTIAAIVLGIGLVVALAFVVLSALVLLWIPVLVVGILIALFSGTAMHYWQRISGWFGGRR